MIILLFKNVLNKTFLKYSKFILVFSLLNYNEFF